MFDFSIKFYVKSNTFTLSNYSQNIYWMLNVIISKLKEVIYMFLKFEILKYNYLKVEGEFVFFSIIKDIIKNFCPFIKGEIHIFTSHYQGEMNIKRSTNS